MLHSCFNIPLTRRPQMTVSTCVAEAFSHQLLFIFPCQLRAKSRQINRNNADGAMMCPLQRTGNSPTQIVMKRKKYAPNFMSGFLAPIITLLDALRCNKKHLCNRKSRFNNNSPSGLRDWWLLASFAYDLVWNIPLCRREIINGV